MKKSLLLFPLLFLVINSGLGRSIIISGSIQPFDYYPVFINGEEIRKNKQGQFEIDLEVTLDTYVSYRHKNVSLQLFVSDDSDLHFAYDSRIPFETIRFEGKHASINHFLAARQSHFRSYAEIIRDSETDLFSLPRDSFLHRIDSLRNTFSTAFSAFALTHPEVNQNFLYDQDLWISFIFDFYLDVYPEFHAFVTQDSVSWQRSVELYLNQQKQAPVEESISFGMYIQILKALYWGIGIGSVQKYFYPDAP